MRDMTHLGEPQSAAGVPALVPDHRADQPRLAGMVVLRRQLTFEFDHKPHLLLPGAAQCSSGLLPDRFILQDERRLWRRIKPRMPMMNQGRPHD